MSRNRLYASLGIYAELVDRVSKLKNDLGLGNKSEAVQVLFAAYDIINNTGYGGRFTEAVKSALEEDKT